METSDLIASAAVCDKARYPTALNVTERGLLLTMHGPNGAGIVASHVVPWSEIDSVQFPPCALVASALCDMEDKTAAALAAAPMPPELSRVERFKLAHAAVTDFVRSGPGALELMLEAAMMNLIMRDGTGAGGKAIGDMANRIAVQCGNARPGSVKLAAID